MSTKGKVNNPIVKSKIEFTPVVISNNSDIGIGAIILPGVIIGKGVQVGAGVMVTKNVRDFAIVAGVPAKEIGLRK
ncbi:MAG: hypothetical protein KJ674_06125 [Nanoarchaeota archaeon]|nr:hypothetical protein [Nanoarchaeota archaeon]